MSLSQFQRLRRFVIAALIAAAFCALLFVHSVWDSETNAIHDLVEAVGLGFIVIGIIGRMWCTLYIGGRKAAEIVDLGPYSITRNPLYVFSSVAALGVGAQTGSVILAAVFFLGCVAAFQFVIRREEEHLTDAFGAPFVAYTQRVPRFWPKWSLYRDQAFLNVDTGRLYQTFRDGTVFFVAKPAFELVEQLQSMDLLPVVLRLY
jgi:protein-S-isoprenylcysteine O-methyltransferase Ste14